MPELSKSSLLKVFKGYMARLTSEPVLTLQEASECLELAFDRCCLLQRENELGKPKQLAKSKIDVSDGMIALQAHNEMITALNHMAEWETDDIRACDEPCAARTSRMILEKYNLKE